MSLFKKILGTMEDLFQIGGPTGHKLKKGIGPDTLEVTDDQDVHIPVTAAKGTQDGQLVEFRQFLNQTTVLVEFGFSGGTPPSAGTNTGEFGICTTAGGSFNEGDIVYDNGASLLVVDMYKGMFIATDTNSYTLTVASQTLNPNTLYQATTSASPYGWIAKGDGFSTGVGQTHWISLTVGTTNATSSTSIPAGSKIQFVSTDVITPYSAGGTLTTIVDGPTVDLSLQAATDNDAEVANNYVNEPFVEVAAGEGGPVVVQVGGTPVAGAATVIVGYVEAYNS